MKKRHPNDQPPPPPPESLAHVMRLFSMVNRGRQFTMVNSGKVIETVFLPLAPSELDATARLLGIRFASWELDAIFMLDDLWRSVMTKKGYSFEDDDPFESALDAG